MNKTSLASIEGIKILTLIKDIDNIKALELVKKISFLDKEKKEIVLINYFFWWAGMDSNHRTQMRTDLQSAAFSHSATYPNIKTKNEYKNVSRFFGAPSRIRTLDQPVMSRLL